MTKEVYRKRLLSRYQISTDIKPGVDTGCWEYTRCVGPNGYGFMAAFGVTWPVHRLAYNLLVGDVGDKNVLHRCDNRKCFNPDHLFLGTQSENIRDMFQKGRNANVERKGEHNPRARLTEIDVLSIREMYASGKHLQRELAKMFSISPTMISYIVLRKTWKHI